MFTSEIKTDPGKGGPPGPNGWSDTQKAALASRLQKARESAGAVHGAASPIPRSEHRTEFPLSFAQEQLWFLDQLDPGNSAYNLAQAAELLGPLDLPALEKSINQIIVRHGVFRSQFFAAAGVPRQSIIPARALSLKIADLAGPAASAGPETLQGVMAEEALRPFDLSKDLLLRALLVRLGAEKHILLLVMPHIVSDGWSLHILFHELGEIYASTACGEPASLPDLPMQYGDFVLWDRDRLGEATAGKHLAYWKEQLGDVPPALNLTGARIETRSAPPAATRPFHISAELADSLKKLSRHEGATLFMTLMAAFEVLLHRYTEQEKIAVGTCVAGRPRRELEGLVGLFVNTLVIRADLSGNPTVSELIARVRETVLAAFAHQDLPFPRLVQELHPERGLGRNPLFQVMFVFQNTPPLPASFGGLESRPVDVPGGTAKFDLTLTMADTPAGLDGTFEYNKELFDEPFMVRLTGHFQRLLEAVAAGPAEHVSRLPLFNPPELQALLVDWNGRRAPESASTNIPGLFEAMAAAAPDAVALSFSSRSMTYGELNARASHLAGYLRRAGVSQDTLVAVSLDRSFELVIALLGVLKAGGAYVSLDPSYPEARLAFLLEDAKPPVLLTQRKYRDLWKPLWDRASAAPSRSGRLPDLLCLDSDWRLAAREKPVSLSDRISPEGLAYVSYTSGSTGEPKGVCITHRGVCRLVQGADFARFDAGEVFLLMSPVAFDASTLEIRAPLLNGGRLVILPPGTPSLSELGETIERSGVTTLWLTAGLFHAMVDQNLNALRGVRQLLAGGDVLSVPHALKAAEKLPGTRLINGYGPTENTTFTCCATVSSSHPPNRPIPIGRPISGTRVYILDGSMNPVPVGVPGEIYAGGEGVARGYLNAPELTAAKFVPDPFSAEPGARLYRTGDRGRWLEDGAVEFLGRSDRQVKIRGFRLELGEVEAALSAHPGVREVIVAAREDKSGDKRLIAYVVGADENAPSLVELRKRCLEKLPDYMVPSAFVFVKGFPLNANGKVDRRSLEALTPASFAVNRTYLAPRDQMERDLTSIWEELLDTKPVGIDENFFELGGHSLLGVRLFARIEEEFGTELPVASLFQAPTVRRLAALIRGKESTVACMSLVAIQAAGAKPPMIFIHGAGGGNLWGYTNLVPFLGPDQPVYGLESRGMRGLREFETIGEMAAHYIEEIRTIQPSGPYYLGGYCFGGNVAQEIARQLCGQGEEVAFLCLLDSIASDASPAWGRWGNPAFVWSFLTNTFWWLADFLQMPAKERRHFIARKLRAWGRKAVQWGRPGHPGSGEIDLADIIEVERFPEIELGLWRKHLSALSGHVPKPCPGRITLFRTRAQPFLCSFDRSGGWGSLTAAGVDVVDIPGSHEKIFLEPHLQAVGREVRRCLGEAHSRMGI